MKVKVRNILGQEIEVSVGWRYSDRRYAWNLKFLTKNCSQCPWCVDGPKAREIIREVNYRKGRRRWMPPVEEKILGLCDWGKRTMILLSKDKLTGCASFGKEPTRAQGKGGTDERKD